MDSGFNVSPPPMTPEQQAMAKRMSKQFSVEPEGGFTNMLADPGFNVLPETTQGMSQEDKNFLESLLQKSQQASMAPLSQQAQELAMQGEGDDTQLAHLRQGEVVLPPEFFEDEQFEDMVEKKFKQFNLDPEQAIVGTGIASLNSVTGLEQFGFFKKIGKSLKKVVKKVAPFAGAIAAPFTGGATAALIGGIGGAASGKGLKGAVQGALGGFGASKLAGIAGLGKGAASAAAKAATGATKTGIFGGTLGPKIKAGIGSFFNPTKKTGIFGGKLGPNIRRGIGGLFGGGQQQTFATDEVIGTLNGEPVTRADLENMTAEQFEQVQLSPVAQQTGIFGGTLGPILRQTFLGSGQQPGVIGNILGGGQQQGGGGLFGGGLGDALKLGGIGALAAGLGKLAYEDAQKQKGVALTPLTTMSPTGRYNIEAEIARRMGQPAPNPVEFGLLPTGTLPELSGGKPRGMMYGGGIMAYAQGGAVQMQEGGEMDPNNFPRMEGDINGPGTETSDDIPAMLSDGEFVMTGRAVRGAGSYEMQADPNGIISLMPTLEENRERGMELMYKMMDTFADKAKAS
jgi:hypothetical protein